MQDHSWNSILASMEKEKIMLRAITNVNKQVLFDLLKNNNVEAIVVTFDGAGGDILLGYIELTPESAQPLLEEPAIGFTWPEYAGTAPDPGLYNVTIKDVIETICYNFLRISNRGWKMDEGAYGTFEFITKDNKVKLDFYERSESNYEYEF